MLREFKQDSIIVIDDIFTVVVASEVRGLQGWNFNYGSKRLDNLPQTYESHSFEWQYCRKIVATIGKRLEGVPLIELPEQENLSLQAAMKEMYNDKNTAIERYYFKEGYKAASKDKKWTDAAIKAFLRTEVYLEKLRAGLNILSAEWKDITDVLIHLELSKQKSIQRKVPTSITLTEELCSKGFQVKNTSDMWWEPIVTNPETNTIIPQSVSYE